MANTNSAPAFITNHLARINMVAPEKVTIGAFATLREFFEYEEGYAQFNQLLDCLREDPRINLVTGEGIVKDGVIIAGKLNETQEIVDHFISQHVDVTLSVNANYGDETAAATIAREVYAARKSPFYTFVFPDLPIRENGKRALDDGCGILPTRQFVRRNLRINPAWIPTAPLDDDVFKNGLTDMLSVAGGIRAARSVRAIQIGPAQQTFPAIEADRQLFRRIFGTNVETVGGGAFRAKLKAGLETPPEWLDGTVEYVKQWIDFSGVEGEYPDTAKLVALAFGYILDLLVEKQANCVTINCWEDVMQQMRFMYCAVNGLMFQHGIMAPCETDLPGVVACSMLQGMVIGQDPTKYIGAFADWTSFDMANRRALFWHCGPFAPSRCRGGNCATCREGWIIPVANGCAGLLDGQWAEIGDVMTMAQIRPDEHDNWTIVAYNGKVTNGPPTIGTHFWLHIENPREMETFNYSHPVDHHNSVMLGDHVRLVPEVARWLGLGSATYDNLAATV